MLLSVTTETEIKNSGLSVGLWERGEGEGEQAGIYVAAIDCNIENGPRELVQLGISYAQARQLILDLQKYLRFAAHENLER